jgi:hypothetical protein
MADLIRSENHVWPHPRQQLRPGRVGGRRSGRHRHEDQLLRNDADQKHAVLNEQKHGKVHVETAFPKDLLFHDTSLC